MGNNELKEKIRKNIKEEIAISNIRKEFDMKTNKNKRIVYTISSICAVFILGVGIFIGTSKLNNNLLQNENLEIGKIENNENKKESLNIELNINVLKDMAMTSLDADTKTIDIDQLPEEFMFIEDLIIPEGYEFENSYAVYTRENKDIEEYNILHDYIFNYRKNDLNNIKIAFSKIALPIRDYYIQGGEKISKIGDVELKMSQWKEMYIVTFNYQNLNFDIETTGITENELVDLLQSIINGIKDSNSMSQVIEDKDIGVKEQTNEDLKTDYPDYYAGKYIDNNGNNVVLLCQENETNRKQICSLLGITENKTTFKTANYRGLRIYQINSSTFIPIINLV